MVAERECLKLEEVRSDDEIIGGLCEKRKEWQGRMTGCYSAAILSQCKAALDDCQDERLGKFTDETSARKNRNRRTTDPSHLW